MRRFIRTVGRPCCDVINRPSTELKSTNRSTGHGRCSTYALHAISGNSSEVATTESLRIGIPEMSASARCDFNNLGVHRLPTKDFLNPVGIIRELATDTRLLTNDTRRRFKPDASASAKLRKR